MKKSKACPSHCQIPVPCSQRSATYALRNPPLLYLTGHRGGAYSDYSPIGFSISGIDKSTGANIDCGSALALSSNGWQPGYGTDWYQNSYIGACNIDPTKNAIVTLNFRDIQQNRSWSSAGIGVPYNGSGWKVDFQNGVYATPK